MLCPKCHCGSCRRSQRRGVRDHFSTLFGLRPWRCRTCGIRFFAWKVPVCYFIYVHCVRCGNLDLQHVSSERVSEDLFAPLKRLMHIPAYRCDPCRLKFFSLRPFRRIPALRHESLPTESPES